MNNQIFNNSTWAVTSFGTPIELFSFLPEGDTERPILFIGGVHGDEPEGVYLAESLVQWMGSVLKQNSCISTRPWLLIPCLNIDGYKNNSRTNANGVDLNRNFPSSDWSSSYKESRYYPGQHPSSEKEVQSLCELINKHKPSQIIHFHSWKPCIVYTGAAGKNTAELFSDCTGYKSSEDIGYPTPGSLGQYGWQIFQIPVICIEEQEGVDKSTIWPRFKSGFEKLLLKK